MEFKPYIISWNLTAACNLRCKHCYIDASRPMAGELSTEEARKTIRQIADVNRETILILTGGEPLLRNDIAEIISEAVDCGMMVVIGTNGVLLTPDVATRLGALGVSGIGISVDSLRAEIHDRFRGMRGAWQLAVQGIKCAVNAGIDVQWQTTLTHSNIGDIEKFIEFARDIGAKVITFFFLVCTGRGQNMVDISSEEYEEALHRISIARRRGIMVRPRCAPTFRRMIARTNPDSLLLKTDAGRCLAGKNYCRITPDGKITPCPYMPLVAGDLRKDTFSDIWFTSNVFRSLRNPALKGKCGACEYREICGGCRARAFAKGADHLSEDPCCAYVPGTGSMPQEKELSVQWSAEALQRLDKVPFFVREVVRSAVESFAASRGVDIITPDIMDQLKMMMKR